MGMKKLSLISVVGTILTVFLLTSLRAQELKNCPCGYNGADCIPCKQQEEDIKEVPKVDEKTFPDCRCGYDPAAGGCVPCKDSAYDATEREMGSQ